MALLFVLQFSVILLVLSVSGVPSPYGTFTEALVASYEKLLSECRTGSTISVRVAIEDCIRYLSSENTWEQQSNGMVEPLRTELNKTLAATRRREIEENYMLPALRGLSTDFANKLNGVLEVMRYPAILLQVQLVTYPDDMNSCGSTAYH